MIKYSYKKYGLNIQSVQTPQLYTQLNLPLSDSTLNYFNFKNKVDFIQSLPSLSLQTHSQGLESYIQETQKLHQQILNHSSHLFSQPSNQLAQDPLFKDWAEKFKMNYFFQTGQSVEKQPFSEIRNHTRGWGLEKWEAQIGGLSGRHLDQVLDKFCPRITHPLEDRKFFNQSIEECAERIYPVYALGTTVHEIGHSIFSLFHNFAGSVDGQNFNSKNDYQIQFLKPYLEIDGRLLTDFFPQVSSSVMDYVSYSDGEQWAPGPYDVEAIRFLYSNNNEDTSLEKSFLKCSEWSIQESSHCLQFDASITPDEQARNIIENLFESLDYNFGRVYNPYSEYVVYYSVSQLMAIYYDWRERLNAFAVHHNFDTNRMTSLEDYEILIQNIIRQAKNPSASKEDQELLSFYKARNLIYHALTYFSFLPNRYCVLKFKPDSSIPLFRRKTRILLEISKVQKFKEDQSYVLPEDIVSCWESEVEQKPHPFVQEYIDHAYSEYELEDERGYFLQTRYTPKNLTYQGLDLAYQAQYYGTFEARLMAFSALFLTEIFYPRGGVSRDRRSPLVMMNERDIEDGLERLIVARTTKGMFFSESENFFTDLDEIDLEDLNPKKSAEILFKFPSYEEGEKDLVFKDDFIQLDKLHEASKSPYVREDQIQTQFYQNFYEEKDLLTLVGQYYSIAKILAGGNYSEEIQKRSSELFSNIQFRPSSTKTLLIDKSVNYMAYGSFPEQAASYHFEYGPLYITPAKNEEALDSISNILISELGLNTIREMMTPQTYIQSFVTNVEGNFVFDYGFTSFITQLLGKLLNFQNLRLGRFYFMYAYTLVLGMLESYEKTLQDYHFEDPEEIHEIVRERMSFFTQTMEKLFHYPKCPLVNNHFKIIGIDFENSTHPELKDQLIRGLDNVWKKNCMNRLAERGKLQALFTSQNYINHDRWAQKNKQDPLIFLSQEFLELNQIYDRQQVYQNNTQLDQEVDALNQQIDITTINTFIFPLFKNFLHIHENDLEETKKVVRFNRNILLDVIPKIMLMYSSDRDFVGEMLYVITNIYSQCTSEYQPDLEMFCQLIVEKMLSYYFSGNVYGTNPQVEKFYLNHVSRRPISVDAGGMPLSVLVQKDSAYYRDNFVNPTAFNLNVIIDYMFFNRNWSIQGNTIDEVLAQRELLFTLLPVVPFQFRSF